MTRTRDELAVVTAELDACLASAPVGFAFHDANGRYRRVNASLALLHGVAADALVGRLPSEAAPGIGQQLDRHVASVIADGAGGFNVEVAGESLASPGATQPWIGIGFPN